MYPAMQHGEVKVGFTTHTEKQKLPSICTCKIVYNIISYLATSPICLFTTVNIESVNINVFHEKDITKGMCLC